MSFNAKNPMTAPKIEKTPPLPLNGARGLFPTPEGWNDINDDGSVEKLGYAKDGIIDVVGTFSRTNDWDQFRIYDKYGKEATDALEAHNGIFRAKAVYEFVEHEREFFFIQGTYHDAYIGRIYVWQYFFTIDDITEKRLTIDMSDEETYPITDEVYASNVSYVSISLSDYILAKHNLETHLADSDIHVNAEDKTNFIIDVGVLENNTDRNNFKIYDKFGNEATTVENAHAGLYRWRTTNDSLELSIDYLIFQTVQMQNFLGNATVSQYFFTSDGKVWLRKFKFIGKQYAITQSHYNNAEWFEYDLSYLEEVFVQLREDIDAHSVGLKTPEGGEIFNDYENNNAIGLNSSASGNGTTAGVMGYYYSDIDFDAKTLTLVAADWSEVTSVGYAVGDVISIINDSKYEECSKITAINGNRITVDSLPFDSLVTVSDSKEDDCSIIVPAKPNVGIVPLGYYAHAEGWNTKALEKGSHSEGRDTTATGQYAHTEGRNTKAYYAAHAEGRDTEALAQAAHTEGYKTKVTANRGHAEGYKTEVNGHSAHSEGVNSVADNAASHAEGADTSTKGYAAHSEGRETAADGDHAHAEGYKTSAKGNHSHTEGLETAAYNESDHAEGTRTGARGGSSHGEGYENTVSGFAAHVEGKGNNVSGDASHGEGYKNTVSGIYTHGEGRRNIVDGLAGHGEGSFNEVYGENAHAEGDHTYATGANQHTQGRYNIIDSEHKYAHIVGNGTGTAERSNAHTLDWDGNAWYAGTVECTGVVLTSPNGTKFKLKVSDMGELITEKIEEVTA